MLRLSCRILGRKFQHETMTYGKVKIKTGAISGTVIGNDRDKAMIPDTTTIAGKVLITVVGRPALCLKCNEVGHMRATCPRNNRDTDSRRSYADVARNTAEVSDVEDREVVPPQDIAREGEGGDSSMVPPQDTAREGERDDSSMVPRKTQPAREGEGSDEAEDNGDDYDSEMEVEERRKKVKTGKKRSREENQDGKKKVSAKVGRPSKEVKKELLKTSSSLPPLIIAGSQPEGGPNPGLSEPVYVG